MRRLIRLGFLVVILMGLLPTLALAHEEDEERNKATFLRIGEMISNGDFADINDVLDPDFVQHSPLGNPDVAGFVGQYSGFHEAMPDLEITTDLIVADGHWVAALVGFSGTFTEDLMMPSGTVPPTGERVSVPAISIYEFNEDGRAVEEWVEFDQQSLLAQFGIIPGGEMEMPVSGMAMEPLEVGTPDDEREDANKDALRRAYEDGFNAGNLDLLDEIFAPEFVAHDADGDTPGVDALKATLGSYLGAMPDAQISIDRLIAEGDWVVSRVTLAGTFTEPLALGPDAVVEPTGEPIQLTSNALHRFNEDGLITDDWEEFDSLGLLIQLGVIPAPAPA